MKFEKTKLDGVYIVTREAFEDERGTFARAFCKREFEAAGLCGDIAQVSMSTNKLKGTLRGLHSLSIELAENKLVMCVRGAIFDVAVDVRKSSATFGQYVGVEVSERSGNALYLPKGFAHGYLTLTDDTQLLYFMSQFYEPSAERGYRYDDPVFDIGWPGEIVVISEKDRGFPLLAQQQNSGGA
jgi:dTDP-4-dehydrorhamnose 3,5-epimerase